MEIEIDAPGAGLRRDVLDAKRLEVLGADLDANDAVRNAGRRDDEIRRQAVAQKTLVFDAACRAIGMRAAERPVAEQAAERDREEQRNQHPADALNTPLFAVKDQVGFT